MLLFAGRIQPLKGLDVAIGALAVLVEVGGEQEGAVQLDAVADGRVVRAVAEAPVVLREGSKDVVFDVEIRQRAANLSRQRAVAPGEANAENRKTGGRERGNGGREL